MVTMRYWAAAKQAAGVAEERFSAATLAEALAVAKSRRATRAASLTGPHPPAGSPSQPGTPSPAGAASGGDGAGSSTEFESVLTRSSFLIDGQQVGRNGLDEVTLRDGAVVEVLPPFAGG